MNQNHSRYCNATAGDDHGQACYLKAAHVGPHSWTQPEALPKGHPAFRPIVDRDDAIRDLVSLAAVSLYDYNDWPGYWQSLNALRALGVTDAEIAESGGL